MPNWKSEDAFVAFLQTITDKTIHSPNLGIGDDAAVVTIESERLVITTDSLVEGTHFKSEWVTPAYLGHKAMRVNLSDIAAMGGIPKYALVSLILSKKMQSVQYIKNLYRAIMQECKPFAISLIGGNMATGRESSITITLIGESKTTPLTRTGANIGDLIFVTGQLGIASAEIAALGHEKIKQMQHLPPIRVDFAHTVAQEKLATACIDISDGLAKDLHRLCSASTVGAQIYKEQIPNIDTQLHDGEDYELLFTAKAENVSRLFELSTQLATPIHLIGQVVAKAKGINMPAIGWDHFSI